MTGQEKKTLIRGFRHKLNELHRRGDISDNQFDIFNNLLQVHLFSYVNEPRIEKEYFELMTDDLFKCLWKVENLMSC